MTAAEFAVAFQSNKTAEEYSRLATLAENIGFDVISVYSDLGFQPPIVALTVIAQATNTVRLGPACLNPFSLAPFEVAGQVAALDIVSGGRAYLGLARGTWLEGVGIDQPRSVTTLREAIEVFRRLLAGDDSGYEGEIFRLSPGIAFAYTPCRPNPPVVVGTWGPQTAAMAGELADEVKVGGSANPDVVPWMRDQIDRGASQIGRDPAEVGICLGAVTVVDEDGASARSLAKEEVAMYLAAVADLDPTVELPAHLLDDVRQRLEVGDRKSAGRMIPDAVLDRFAFAGTPEHVASQVESIVRAGATRIEFGTPHGLTAEQGIRLLGERVLPQLR